MSSNTNDKVSTGKIVLCTLIVFLALITLPTIIKAIPILFFSGLAALFVGCALLLFVIIGASYKEHKKSKKLREEFLAQFEDQKES